MELPESIQRVLAEVVRVARPDRITLFGSRARGNHRENSDFDLCIAGRKCSDGDWARLLVEIQEGELTLLPVDLVEYEKLNPNYRSAIDREGKVLFGPA